MFLSWNWEKVYSKKISKSISRRRKTINSLKNYFSDKKLCKEWSAQAQLGDDNNNNNTYFLSLLSIKKIQKFFLKLPYNTHGKRFIVYLWVMVALMGGVLVGLLSSQQLEEYFIEVISMLNGNIQQARAIGHFRVA